MMKTLQEALMAFNAREANENTIQGMLAEIAVLVLSGGYFLVNEDTRIYPMDIEFYLYGEKESDKKIPWIRDANMYHKGKGVPYFPVVGTFYPHESGVDVTFENEKEEYRASFLIRQYKYEEGGRPLKNRVIFGKICSAMSRSSQSRAFESNGLMASKTST